MVALLIVFAVFVLSAFIPLKLTLSSLPSNVNEDFYIIRYSQELSNWEVLGDKNGMFIKNLSQDRIIKPKMRKFVFQKDVSTDILQSTYVVYGSITINEKWESWYGDTSDAIRYTIDDAKWDILEKIETRNKLRRIFPRSYLTVYDYRWFDVLRDKLFYYLDGSTNF